MFYFWLCLICLLAVIEAMTVNLVSIWFIASAILALIISFITDNFVIQFGIFVIVGVILLITTKKSLEQKLIKKEKTNFDRIIGMKGVVTEKIEEFNIGEVKVDGKKWSAISNASIEVGEKVKVLKINGVKIEVERWEE